MPINCISTSLPLLKPTHVTEVETKQTVGACVDPFVAMINHSCDPNAWWIYESKEIRIRARRQIAEGEELTVSYKGAEGDFQTRRASLKKNWGFDCKSLPC